MGQISADGFSTRSCPFSVTFLKGQADASQEVTNRPSCSSSPADSSLCLAQNRTSASVADASGEWRTRAKGMASGCPPRRADEAIRRHMWSQCLSSAVARQGRPLGRIARRLQQYGFNRAPQGPRHLGPATEPDDEIRPSSRDAD